MREGLTSSEMAALSESGFFSEDDRDPLEHLGRRIAGQYVDALLPGLTEVIDSATSEVSASSLDHTRDSLRQLMKATGDHAFEAHLERLESMMARAKAEREAQRNAFMVELKGWVDGLASLLEPEDATRLRSQIDANLASVPSSSFLLAVPGMGRELLRRLYRAGLFDASTLGSADPLDVAAVTGMPISLAFACVEAAEDLTTA